MPEQFLGLVEIQKAADPAFITTVSLNGENADVLIGGNGQSGEIRLFRGAGNPTNPADATIHVDGELADLRMGGNGVNGDAARSVPPATSRTTRRRSVRLDAQRANALLGGNGIDGDVLLFRGNGDPTDTRNCDGEA